MAECAAYNRAVQERGGPELDKKQTQLTVLALTKPVLALLHYSVAEKNNSDKIKVSAPASTAVTTIVLRGGLCSSE